MSASDVLAIVPVDFFPRVNPIFYETWTRIKTQKIRNLFTVGKKDFLLKKVTSVDFFPVFVSRAFFLLQFRLQSGQERYEDR